MRCEPCDKRFRIKGYNPAKDYNCPACGDALGIEGDEPDTATPLPGSVYMDEDEAAAEAEAAAPAREGTRRRTGSRARGGGGTKRRKGPAKVDRSGSAGKRMKNPDTFYYRNKTLINVGIFLTILAVCGYVGWSLYARCGYDKDQDPGAKDQAIRTVLKALGNEHEAVRAPALDFVDGMPNTQENAEWIEIMGDPLVFLLDNETDPEKQKRLIRILGQNADGRAVKPMVKIWPTASFKLQERILESLGKIPTKPSALHMIEVALHTDEHRTMAAEKLSELLPSLFQDSDGIKQPAEIGNRGMTPAELAVMIALQRKDDDDDRLIEAYRVGEFKSNDQEIQRWVAERLVEGFADENPDVGFACAMSLNRVEPMLLFKPIQHVLDESSNPKERAVCAYYMGIQRHVDNPRKTRFKSLLNAYESEADVETRKAMLIAMGRTGDDRAPALLIDVLKKAGEEAEAAHRGLVLFNDFTDLGKDPAKWEAEFK
jgi:hypothetical protein